MLVEMTVVTLLLRRRTLLAFIAPHNQEKPAGYIEQPAFWLRVSAFESEHTLRCLARFGGGRIRLERHGEAVKRLAGDDLRRWVWRCRNAAAPGVRQEPRTRW